MKPFDTTTPTPTPGTRYDAPETFVVKRAKAVMLAFLAAGLFVLAVWTVAQGWTVVAVVAGVLALFVAFNAWLLWEYSSRLVERELPRNRQAKAQRVGDEWIINLKREIPVSDRGAVEMEPTRVKLPAEPREFTRIVREMMRRGTGIDNRPPGVSQPMRTKILRTLEDLDGATNGGQGVGWKLADDLDALLRDIDRW